MRAASPRGGNAGGRRASVQPVQSPTQMSQEKPTAVAGTKGLREAKHFQKSADRRTSISLSGPKATVISAKYKDLPKRFRAMINELVEHLSAVASGPALSSAFRAEEMKRDDWDAVEGWVNRKARAVVSTAPPAASPGRQSPVTRGALNEAAEGVSLSFLTASEVEVLNGAISTHMRNGSAAQFTGFTKAQFHDFIVKEAPEIARKSARIFEAVDADQSGDISFLEFVAALLSTRKAGGGGAAAPSASSMTLPQKETSEMQLPSESSPSRSRAFAEWLQVLEGLRQEMHVLSMIGSPTDEDLELLESRKATYDAYKKSCAVQLPKEDVELGPENVDKTFELVEQLCREGDDRDGSLELAAAIVAKFGLAAMKDHVLGSDMLYDLCVDGNTNLLKMFLAAAGSAGLYDPLLLLQSASYSQAKQKAALLQLVIPAVDMAENTEDFVTVCEELFTDLVALQDMGERYEIMETLLSHPQLAGKLAGLTEENVLIPCCKYGDVKLLDLLLKHVPRIVRPTLLVDDGIVPLVHSVMHNQTAFLERALALPDIALDIEMETGTLLGIADALGKKECFDMLKKAGASVMKCTLT